MAQQRFRHSKGTVATQELAAAAKAVAAMAVMAMAVMAMEAMLMAATATGNCGRESNR